MCRQTRSEPWKVRNEVGQLQSETEGQRREIASLSSRLEEETNADNTSNDDVRELDYNCRRSRFGHHCPCGRGLSGMMVRKTFEFVNYLNLPIGYDREAESGSGTIWERSSFVDHHQPLEYVVKRMD